MMYHDDDGGDNDDGGDTGPGQFSNSRERAIQLPRTRFLEAAHVWGGGRAGLGHAGPLGGGGTAVGTALGVGPLPGANKPVM